MVGCGLVLCRAVAAAHQPGVIHGDLTPNNLLRENTGRCIRPTFGFSQIVGQPIFDTVRGIPGYLAPEQLADAFSTVDRRLWRRMHAVLTAVGKSASHKSGSSRLVAPLSTLPVPEGRSAEARRPR